MCITWSSLSSWIGPFRKNFQQERPIRDAGNTPEPLEGGISITYRNNLKSNLDIEHCILLAKPFSLNETDYAILHVGPDIVTYIDRPNAAASMPLNNSTNWQIQGPQICLAQLGETCAEPNDSRLQEVPSTYSRSKEHWYSKQNYLNTLS